MTTKVTVDAHAGWPVKVTSVLGAPGQPTKQSEAIVPANTVQDFYIHSGMRIVGVEEMPRES